MGGYILAIDQGTTSSRAIVFDGKQQVAGLDQKEFRQHFPKSGWVEHDPEEIWDSVVVTVNEAIRKAGISPSDIAGIGITNQRETVVVWDRETGKPIHNAIVWQDRRTAAYCDKLKKTGSRKDLHQEDRSAARSLFLRHQAQLAAVECEGRRRRRAAKGELCFGTIDTFLIWRLTGGKSFVTDATNASRTLLYNIADNAWDDELLEILRVPARHAAGGEGLRRRFRRHRHGSSSARRSRSSALPATSRPPPSARPASSRAC